jgi:hypothetical protein
MDSRVAGLARAVLVIAVVAACLPASAGAVPAAGITAFTTLVTFDTLAPMDVHLRPIAGLQSPSEVAIGLDTRPATGQLFLVTVPNGVVGNALIRTYTLDPVTAAATFVGSIPSTVPGAGDYPTGLDFRPDVDRLRVVQSDNENFRINPNNGSLAGDDPNLTYTAPATGPSPHWPTTGTSRPGLRARLRRRARRQPCTGSTSGRTGSWFRAASTEPASAARTAEWSRASVRSA